MSERPTSSIDVAVEDPDFRHAESRVEGKFLQGLVLRTADLDHDVRGAFEESVMDHGAELAKASPLET